MTVAIKRNVCEHQVKQQLLTTIRYRNVIVRMNAIVIDALPLNESQSLISIELPSHILQPKLIFENAFALAAANNLSYLSQFCFFSCVFDLYFD